MKKYFFPAALFLIQSGYVNLCVAQFTITPGAQITFSGNGQLTLSDLDLIDNGSLSAGTGSILFTGKANSLISGSQAISLYDLGIGKTNAYVQMKSPLMVNHHVLFNSGLLDLNSNDLNLGSTGSLIGEQETSRIIGANGGTVIASAILDAPTSVNPANLGITITSTQNWGNTVIKRGHQSQVNASGNGNSIFRYFDLSPANNVAPDATIRLNYFDAELNNLDESALVVWQNITGQKWAIVGFDTRDVNTNFVEKAAITGFGRFTLSSQSNPLPIRFGSFTARCSGSAVILSWRTEFEENSSFFRVEKSIDGVLWTTVTSVAAAGNSGVETDYSYADNSTIAGIYRIAEFDLDGLSTVTRSIPIDCLEQGELKIWPNPVHDKLNVDVPPHAGVSVTIKLFDARGALIKQESVNPETGNHVFYMTMTDLAAGVYYLTIINPTGQVQTTKIIKD